MSEWAWADQAACRGDLSFTDRPADEQAATCRRCPVRFECLELGVEQARGNSACGVGFGGRTSVEVLEIARTRGGRRTLPVRQLRCVQCGARFEARSATARYCSKTCRQRTYAARIRAERS